MTVNSFDLVEQPWIDAVDLDGNFVRLGLREVFERAPGLLSIQFPTAAQNGATLRFLEALTYRVTGLDNPVGATPWTKARDEILAAGHFDGERVTKYFAEQADRFDLANKDRPFGQDPRLVDEGITPKTIGKLVPYIPAGNNFVWFTERPVPTKVTAQEAASWLLVSHVFASGGKTGSRQNDSTAVASLPRGRVSYHLQGRSLFESLMVNLILPKGDVQPTPWEGDLPDIDKDAVLTGLDDPVNRTLGRWPQALLLSWDDEGSVVGVLGSWMYRNVDSTCRDPHLAYRLSPQKDVDVVALSADPSRALWRDLAALNASPDPANDSLVGLSELVSSVEGLPDEIAESLTVRSISYRVDKSKELGWWESVTPEPVGNWMSTDRATKKRVIEATEMAETLGKQIRGSFGEIKKALDSAGSLFSHRDKAVAEFYDGAERIFWEAIHSDSSDFGLSLTRLAVDCYDRHTSPYAGTGRTAPAAAKGRALLWSKHNATNTGTAE